MSAYQNSGLCAGKCPAGKICPTPATYTAVYCPAGAYCPEGSAVEISCPPGTYSNTIGLNAVSQCTPRDLGHSCSIGSTAPQPCAPGTVAGVVGKATCNACEAGKYQDTAAQQACTNCPAGCKPSRALEWVESPRMPCRLLTSIVVAAQISVPLERRQLFRAPKGRRRIHRSRT